MCSLTLSDEIQGMMGRWIKINQYLCTEQLNVVILEDYSFELCINLVRFWIRGQNRELLHPDLRQFCQGLNAVIVSSQSLSKTTVLKYIERQGSELAVDLKPLLRVWPLNAQGLQYLNIPKLKLQIHFYFGELKQGIKNFELTADWLWVNQQAGLLDEIGQDLVDRFCRLNSLLYVRELSSEQRHFIQRSGFEVFSPHHEFICRNTSAAKLANSLSSPKHVAVIGGGIAGSSVAFALCQQGIQVSLFEANPGPGQGSSGNWVGAFHPHFTRNDDFLSQLTRLGCSHTVSQLMNLSEMGLITEGKDWAQPGHLQWVSPENKIFVADWVQRIQTNDSWVSWLDERQAFKQSPAGLWFASGGWVKPVAWVKANLKACGNLLQTHYNHNLTVLPSGFDAVVVACAQRSLEFVNNSQFVAHQVKGQVTLVQKKDNLPCVLSGQSYAIDTQEDWLLLGATYERPVADLTSSDEANQKNIEQFTKTCPGFSIGSIVDQRCGVRSVWADRLPVIGPVDSQSNIYLTTGFGSRGFTWAAMAAWQITRLLGVRPRDGRIKFYDNLLPQRFIQSKR